MRQIEESTSCNEAEKIVRTYKEEVNLAYFSPAESIEHVMEELNEVGVRLSEKRRKSLKRNAASTE